MISSPSNLKMEHIFTVLRHFIYAKNFYRTAIDNFRHWCVEYIKSLGVVDLRPNSQIIEVKFSQNYFFTIKRSVCTLPSETMRTI